MRFRNQNRLLAMLTAAGVALAVSMMAVPSAHAGPQDTAPQGIWVANNSQGVASGPGKGVRYVGLYAKGFWSSSGDVGYCAGDDRPGPSMAPKDANYPVPTPVTKALVTPTLGTIEGELIGQYAYVLNRYGVPQEPDPAKRAQQMEAVDHALALLKFGPDFQKKPTVRKQLSPAAPESSRTLAEQIAEEAKRYAGQLKPQTLVLTSTGSQLMDVAGIELLSPTGAKVPGVRYTVNVDGPAVFEDTGVRTRTGNTGGPGTERLRITGAGQITVTVTYHQVPRPDLLHTKHATYQNLFIAGYTTDLTAKVQVANLAQAHLATKVGEPISKHGDQIYDTVSLTGAGNSDSLLVTAELFYAGLERPELSGQAPKGHTPVATVSERVTVDEHGNLDAYVMPTVTIPPAWSPGFYTWVVSYPQTKLTAATTSNYGEPTETFNLTPHEVIATTQTSAAVTQVGGRIYDTVLVNSPTGLSSPVSVTSKLWGPFTTKPTPETPFPEREDLVGESTTIATLNQPYATEPVTVELPGWYSWSTHIAPSQTANGWDSALAEPNEVTLVKWQPHVRTQTAQAVAEPGIELADHLNVTGLAPNSTVTVESTLWGPFDTEPVELLDPPQDAPVAGTVSTTVTADEWGMSAVTTPTIALSEPGWYVWTEEIPSDDLHEFWSSPWGQKSETTFVTPPLTPPVEEPEVEVPVVEGPEVEVPVVEEPEVAPKASDTFEEESPAEQLAQTGADGTQLILLSSVIAGVGLLALAVYLVRRDQDFDAAGPPRRVIG